MEIGSFSIPEDLSNRPTAISNITINEVWQKSNETDFLFTEVFIFFKRQCYPFQNSSLGQLHTDGDVVPTFVSSVGSLQPVRSSACPLHSFGGFQKYRNDVLWLTVCPGGTNSVLTIPLLSRKNQH